jgi:MerR family transcriptional regulator, light-induced transcriptional regulator
MMSDDEGSGSLRISELARLTGMPIATLRTWESRYGFPTPSREGGGARRYHPRDVRLVLEVSRLRQNGLSVPAAIEAAKREQAPSTQSFFARLRDRWPEFGSYILSQPALLAMSKAIEDEYCTRAARPVLFAAFQRESAYRRVEGRWSELARTAAHTTVFAGFPTGRDLGDRMVEVPLRADAAARREWTLVCDAPGCAACIAGVELPRSGRSAPRRFEVLWSLDGQVVREATRAGISLLAPHDPERAARVTTLLDSTVAVPSDDLRRATSLFSRMMTYRDT